MAGNSLWDLEKALFTKLPPPSTVINPHLKPEKPQVSQKKPSKWDPPDTSFKVDLSSVTSYEDIGNINWTNLQYFKGVERSEKGTEGLFYVETEAGVFIVKRSTNIASEVFCALLSMRLGLHAPKVRVVSSNSEEGNNLLACLEAIDKSFRVITTLANQSNILLMEFVRGITLNKLNTTTAPEVLQKETLKQLGSLMALDVIINNSDRLPLAWTNEGNFDNIMLLERGAIVVPIDSKIIPLEISHPHGERVRELLQTALTHPNHETSQFHRIRDLVTLYTGYDIGTEGSVSLQEGFLATVRECAALDLTSFEKELISWQEALQQHHNLSISQQAVPFIIRMLQIFHDAIHNPTASLPSSTHASTSSVSTSSATSSTSSAASSASSSHSASSKSLINISECAWIKVVVPNEKPAPRRYHSGVLHEGKLYIFGGVCVKTASNDFYVFDFNSKKWAIVVANGEAPTPRCGHSAVVHNGKMWIFGGHDNNRHPFNDLYTFDFATATWKIVEAATNIWPSPRYHHSATLVQDNWIVFGGAVDKSKYLNEVYTYNFETNNWTLLSTSGDFPEPRAGHVAVEYNGSLFIFGGYGGDGGYTPYVDTYALELGTNTFREVDGSGTFPRTARPLSYVPYYFGQGANRECVVFIFGGSDGKSPLGSLFMWNVQAQKWKIIKAWMAMDEANTFGSVAAVALGKMDPIPRYGHCTVLLDEGLLTIFGGSGSLFLDDIVQFDLTD